LGLQLEARIDPGETEPINLVGAVRYGEPPAHVSPASAPATGAAPVNPALTRPFERGVDRRTAAAAHDDEVPPPGADAAAAALAQQRGVAIHRMLQCLTARGAERSAVRRRIAREFAATLDADRLNECWREACGVLDHPALQRFFDPRAYRG